MRSDSFLFIIALVTAFVTGNIFFTVKTNKEVGISDLKEIQQLNIDLQTDYIPYIRLDLNLDFPNDQFLKLLQPTQALNTVNPYPTFNSVQCMKTQIDRLSSEFINKETLWLGYMCNQIEQLPKNFYKTPPFMHPAGQSYAFLKFQQLSSSELKIDWFRKYSKFMHVNELRKINIPRDRYDNFLFSISSQIIQRILNGDKIILTEDYYLIKTGRLKYYVIKKDKAMKFFSRARYNISTDQNQCFLKLGNVCWNKKPHNIISILSDSTFILLLMSLGIFLFSAITLYNRFKTKRAQEERKKHALRVLTHELRTPIASLLLRINDLSEKELSPDVEDEIIKIESDIYRLKHLAEKSRSYLQTDSSELVSLNISTIDSMNDFILDIIHEYWEIQSCIQIVNEEDFSIETDQYWLKMCITNLVDNALRYGASPIKIIIKSESKYNQIIVQDEGHMPYKNLKELLNAKHKDSKGLGMGMIIVVKTLKYMGIEIDLKREPTQFVLSFKR